MSESIAAVAESDADRWRAWQKRGVEHDRRRGVAEKWVIAIAAIVLGGWLSQVF
jgi:hypothetical protein